MVSLPIMSLWYNCPSDWCYTTTSCMFLQYNLPYFVPYKWKCNGGAPYCGESHGGLVLLNVPSHDLDDIDDDLADIVHVVGGRQGGDSCSHQLCECDREFVSCLAQYSCPHTKAMCKSPWRYFQNLFMGLGTGMVSTEHSYTRWHKLTLQHFSPWQSTATIRTLSTDLHTGRSQRHLSSTPSLSSLTDWDWTWSSGITFRSLGDTLFKFNNSFCN